MKRTLGENDLIWEVMADLANRQLGGNQVVAIHLEREITQQVYEEFSYLAGEHSAGVAEHRHELQVGLGEWKSSKLGADGHSSTTWGCWLFQLWWLDFLENIPFYSISAAF